MWRKAGQGAFPNFYLNRDFSNGDNLPNETKKCNTRNAKSYLKKLKPSNLKHPIIELCKMNFEDKEVQDTKIT